MRAIRFDPLSGSAGTPGKFILSHEQIGGPERIPSRDIRFRTHYLPWGPQRVEIACPDVGTSDHLDRRTAPGAAC